MSVNVSKQKRDRLVEKINKIKKYIASAKQDENTAQLLTYIADIEKDIKGKKYGLVFEEHREAIDEILEENTPVLTEKKDLFIDNGGQMNFLIEGDNLAALQLLEKTHKGKIDLIYIDPPYNTGNKDFVYDDVFVDINDTFRHSKWLSFMGKRLEIAKRLLSNQGFIFISIDDNEQAELKLLCDRVFGEDNFIATYIKQSKVGGGSDSKFIVKEHEYCIVYSKCYDTAGEMFITHDQDYLKRYKEEDEKGKFFWDTFARPGLKNPIHYNIIAPDGTIMDYGWIHGKDRFEQELADGTVRIIPKKDGGWSVQFKQYLNKNGRKPRSMTMDFGGSIEGKNDLSLLFDNKKIFSYPKSVKFISTLISTINDTECTVLDFFAGSGTTGHAVMKLNAEYGGKRKFILCTNNENNICRDVTYERIKRVIARDKYEASLKYYKVDFVPISDKLYYEYADELLKHIRELVELENGVNFNDNAEIAIVLTEKELDAFAASIPDKCKTIYLGHDVLPGEVQESIFRARGIAVNIIPDYYYRELEG